MAISHLTLLLYASCYWRDTESVNITFWALLHFPSEPVCIQLCHSCPPVLLEWLTGVCRIDELSSVCRSHPHTSGHDQPIPVTGSVLVVLTLVWLPSRFVSSLHVFVSSVCLSLSSHVPPSGTNARHWALLSPRPHPRVPCQNPICWQVHTCIYFLCYHYCGFFFFLFFHLFLSSWCVLMCWMIKSDFGFGFLILLLSIHYERYSGYVCLWSKQRKGPLSLQDFRLIAVLGRGHFGKVPCLIIIPPHALYEKTYCMSARRCCCRSIRRQGRCMPSKPWRKET